MKKINHKHKFSYKIGDLKITKALEEGITTFRKFLNKKNIIFDENTMRWITIHDENGKKQHILIYKDTGVILAGMGGTHNGKSIKDVFKDFDENKHIGFNKNEALTGEAIHYECSLEEHTELSQKERKYITDYSGVKYENVNDCLRNYRDKDKEEIVGYSSMTVSELEKYADVISGALARHKTPKPIITYRGIDIDYVSKIKKDLVVGNKLYDYGFASTSSDIRVAEDFVGDGYLMEVHIPKGSRAASIDSLSNFAGDEKEVLIDKGACFLIKEVDKENKRLIVELSHEED